MFAIIEVGLTVSIYAANEFKTILYFSGLFYEHSVV